MPDAAPSRGVARPSLWCAAGPGIRKPTRGAAGRGLAGRAADILSEFEGGTQAGEAAELAPDQVWNRLVFYTVADALPGDDPHEVRGLQAYRYLAELGRTDKQLGATSSGPGSTSLAEKPGFSELLALALEHGAIEQSVSGTGLTLSTSPYAFVRLLEPDNAANFEQYGLWRRIGGSVTFDMRSEDPTIANVDINQVAEWSIRVRVIGDRSTRTKKFTQRWSEVVQPKIQARLNALSGGISKALNGSPELRDAADASSETLKGQIAGYLESSDGVPREQRIETITTMTLSALKSTVFDPISESRIALSEETFRGITVAMSGLVKAHQDLFSAQQDLGGIHESSTGRRCSPSRLPITPRSRGWCIRRQAALRCPPRSLRRRGQRVHLLVRPSGSGF